MQSSLLCVCVFYWYILLHTNNCNSSHISSNLSSICPSFIVANSAFNALKNESHKKYILVYKALKFSDNKAKVITKNNLSSSLLTNIPVFLDQLAFLILHSIVLRAV